MDISASYYAYFTHTPTYTNINCKYTRVYEPNQPYGSAILIAALEVLPLDIIFKSRWHFSVCIKLQSYHLLLICLLPSYVCQHIFDLNTWLLCSAYITEHFHHLLFHNIYLYIMVTLLPIFHMYKMWKCVCLGKNIFVCLSFVYVYVCAVIYSSLLTFHEEFDPIGSPTPLPQPQHIYRYPLHRLYMDMCACVCVYVCVRVYIAATLT